MVHQGLIALSDNGLILQRKRHPELGAQDLPNPPTLLDRLVLICSAININDKGK